MGIGVTTIVKWEEGDNVNVRLPWLRHCSTLLNFSGHRVTVVAVRGDYHVTQKAKDEKTEAWEVMLLRMAACFTGVLPLFAYIGARIFHAANNFIDINHPLLRYGGIDGKQFNDEILRRDTEMKAAIAAKNAAAQEVATVREELQANVALMKTLKESVREIPTPVLPVPVALVPPPSPPPIIRRTADGALLIAIHQLQARLRICEEKLAKAEKMNQALVADLDRFNCIKGKIVSRAKEMNTAGAAEAAEIVQDLALQMKAFDEACHSEQDEKRAQDLFLKSCITLGDGEARRA